MQGISYSMLNAIGYHRAVGQQPRLARASTAKELSELSRTSEGESMARRSRLFKAVSYLRDKGFRPNHAISTIREVVMEGADGMRALATSRGEAIIDDHVEQRFLNG